MLFYLNPNPNWRGVVSYVRLQQVELVSSSAPWPLLLPQFAESGMSPAMSKKTVPATRCELYFWHVDDEITNQLIGIMMYFNGEDESKDMYLYINYLGAIVLAGISVYNAMPNN